jgi:hypothetical protein
MAYADAGEVVEPDSELECTGPIALKYLHDVQIALLPRRFAFIPVSKIADANTKAQTLVNDKGDRLYTHPKQGRTEGSVDVFAAIGMAMEAQMEAIAVIDTKCLRPSEFDDLSTEQGRELFGLVRDSEEDFRAAVRQTLWFKAPIQALNDVEDLTYSFERLSINRTDAKVPPYIKPTHEIDDILQGNDFRIRRQMEVLRKSLHKLSVDESSIQKANRGVISMEKIAWINDCKPSVQCSRPRSDNDDPPMLANSVRKAMTNGSFGAVAEVVHQVNVQERKDAASQFDYETNQMRDKMRADSVRRVDTAESSKAAAEAVRKVQDKCVIANNRGERGGDLKGHNIVVVSDVSVQEVKEKDQPTNASMRNFFRHYLPKDTRATRVKSFELMKAEEKLLADKVKPDPEGRAYIWIRYANFKVLNELNQLVDSERQDFRLCRVWWDGPRSRMCWAPIACPTFFASTITPSPTWRDGSGAVNPRRRASSRSAPAAPPAQPAPRRGTRGPSSASTGRLPDSPPAPARR